MTKTVQKSSNAQPKRAPFERPFPIPSNNIQKSNLDRWEAECSFSLYMKDEKAILQQQQTIALSGMSIAREALISIHPK